MLLILTGAALLTITFGSSGGGSCQGPLDCNGKECLDCSCEDKKCVCTDGYSGDHCQTPFCVDRTGCSNHGNCSQTVRNVSCICDPSFEGPRCELSKCELNCSLHGGVRNSACTECVGCQGAWTGASDEGLAFYALASTAQTYDVNLYSCDTDHIFSTTPTGPNVLLQNQSLPAFSMMVAAAGPYVAQVDDTGHLRVYQSIPATSSIVWDSGNHPSVSSPNTIYSLKLQKDGRLVVISSGGEIAWASSSTPLPIGDYFVEIQDSGILKIFTGKPSDIGDIVWQSTRGNVSSPCTLEGVPFNGVLANTTGSIPVYEYFNPTTNDHTYQTSKVPPAGYGPSAGSAPVRFYAFANNDASAGQVSPFYASRLCVGGWCDTMLTSNTTYRKSCDYYDHSVGVDSLLKVMNDSYLAALQELNSTLPQHPLCQVGQKCVGWGVDQFDGRVTMTSIVKLTLDPTDPATHWHGFLAPQNVDFKAVTNVQPTFPPLSPGVYPLPSDFVSRMHDIVGQTSGLSGIYGTPWGDILADYYNSPADEALSVIQAHFGLYSMQIPALDQVGLQW